MMRIRFNRHKLKNISKKSYYGWFLLTFLTIGLLLDVFQSPERVMSHIQDEDIQIEKVLLINSQGTKGSRYKLVIHADDQVYVVHYPRSSFHDYRDKIEAELLTGSIEHVHAKILTRPMNLYELVLGHRQIVDLRSVTTVYYNIDTEYQHQRETYIYAWILFPTVLILWVFFSFFGLLVSKVIVWEEDH